MTRLNDETVHGKVVFFLCFVSAGARRMKRMPWYSVDSSKQLRQDAYVANVCFDHTASCRNHLWRLESGTSMAVEYFASLLLKIS